MAHRRTLLCVHPHPDDESIACGGVLARAASQGHRTVVVTCTGGEAGDNLAGIDLGDEDLVIHRQRELADALAILGVSEHVWLGYRDSGMAGSDANTHMDSFHQADTDAAALRLAAVIRRERPDVVVSDDRTGTYGHPDHVKAWHVTVRAVELAADPDAALAGEPWRVPKRYVLTWGRGRILAVHQGLLEAGIPSPFGEQDLASSDEVPFGTADDEITTCIDVTAWLPAKRAALAAHRSQIGPESFFLNVPEVFTTRLFGTEEFVLEDGMLGVGVGVAERETDLFAGLSPHGEPGAATGAGIASTVTADQFRTIVGRFASGVTVMTTRTPDEDLHAMTVSSVASVSLDPLLVLACVDRAATMAGKVVEAGCFALSFLADDQAELSRRFADPARPPGAAQLEGVVVRPAITGAPVLQDSHGFVDCQVWAVHDGGDHVIVVGEVVDLGPGAGGPLVRHEGRYGRFAPQD